MTTNKTLNYMPADKTRNYMPDDAVTRLWCCDEADFYDFAKKYELTCDKFSDRQTGWQGIRASSTGSGGVWVYYYGDEKMYFYAE